MYLISNVIGRITDLERDLNRDEEYMNPKIFRSYYSCPCKHSDNMEFFKSFLRAIGLLEPAKVDFVSELPMEVSQLILRKLDPESLMCAAQVSRKWLNVCSSDRVLRQCVRRHKRRTERRMRKAFLGQDFPEQTSRVALRKQRDKKGMPRNVPRARFETAAIFGRDEHRWNMVKRNQRVVRMNPRFTVC